MFQFSPTALRFGFAGTWGSVGAAAPLAEGSGPRPLAVHAARFFPGDRIGGDLPIAFLSPLAFVQMRIRNLVWHPTKRDIL